MLYSVALHFSIVLFFIAAGLVSKYGSPPAQNAYFFQMVSVPRGGYQRPARQPATQPAAPKKTLPSPVSNVKKTISRPQPKETPVPAEDMPVPQADMPISSEDLPTSLAAAGVPGLSLEVQGSGFRYSYYEALVQASIKGNWNPPEELLEGDQVKTVIVNFSVRRSGEIMEIKIAESSWNTILDRQALRAVELAQLPPLPAAYEGEKVDFQIKLNLIKKN